MTAPMAEQQRRLLIVVDNAMLAAMLERAVPPGVMVRAAGAALTGWSFTAIVVATSLSGQERERLIESIRCRLLPGGRLVS